jgi:hypothetical protein
MGTRSRAPYRHVARRAPPPARHALEPAQPRTAHDGGTALSVACGGPDINTEN